MEEKEIRAALESHWSASAAGDQDAEHDTYAANAICDYPQSGERIIGRQNLEALRSHHPGKPSSFASFGFWDRAISGSRSTPSLTRAAWPTPSASWNSGMARWFTRRSTSLTRSRPRHGVPNGFNKWDCPRNELV